MRAIDFLRSSELTLRISEVRNRVETAIKDGEIAIVGSAALPQKCAAAVQSAGGKVTCFIEYDARFWGRDVAGIPVVSPTRARELLGPRALVIVGVWSPHHRYAETHAWMQSFGLSHVLPVAALFWVLPQQLGSHYQLAGPEGLVAGYEQIAAIYEALGDERSKQQFADHLRWRVTLDHSVIPAPDRHHVYFDRGMFSLPANCVIADCGAFDGDSLRSFLYWHGGHFGRFHAFEPDPISFDRLGAYVRSLPADVAARIAPAQFALGDAETTIRISGTGKPGSNLKQGEDAALVRCVRLDDVFASEKIHYLKLDIEGAEWGALRGAAGIIQRDRPVLAAAIYHQPEDIFKLPAFLMEQTSNYRYFMRSHDDDGIDFVFYAVPDELAA